MTVKMIKATIKEADRIFAKGFGHLFRGTDHVYAPNDIVQLIVMDKGKSVEHISDGKYYRVTAVMNSINAPLEKGWQMIEVKGV